MKIWISIDLHLKFVIQLVDDLPKEFQKCAKLLDLHVKFPLIVKFTRFNFLTQIFGKKKHEITTREDLSPQHCQRVEVMDNFNPDEPIPYIPM